MVKVGIIGDDAGRMAGAVKTANPQFDVNCVKNLENPQKYDIMIINDPSPMRRVAGDCEISADITLIGAEDASSLRGMAGAGRVITYGMSGKSCITASSISDNGMMLCVQRAIPTISGELIQPQELFADFNSAIGQTHEQLGAAACGLVGNLR